MKSLQLFVLVVLVAGAAGAGGYYARPLIAVLSSKDSDLASSIRAKKEGDESSSKHRVSSLGRLEPESEIVDVGAAAGSRIDSIVIEEGRSIKRGEPLAYLDSHGEMEASCKFAESQLREAERRLKAETDYGRALIDEAKLKVTHVLEVVPLGIEAQAAEVERTRYELEKVRKDRERSRNMLTDRAIPQSQYDDVNLLTYQSEQVLKRNSSTLAQMKSDREIKLRLARAELASAEAALVRSQVTTQVDSLKEALSLAKSRLDRTIIRAPIDGSIIKVLAHAGESVSGTPILKMGSIQSMFATAEVYETDIRDIKVGQTAKVTSKAFPETLEGRIERVGTLVHKNDVLKIDPTADADTRVIEVRIRLSEKDSQIAARYNHLQVDVEIEAEGSKEPS